METADQAAGKARLWLASVRPQLAASSRSRMWRAGLPYSGQAAIFSFATWKGRPRLFTAFTRTAPDCRRCAPSRYFFCTPSHQMAAGSSGWAPLPGNGPPLIQAFPLDGGPPIQIGAAFIFLGWSLDGRSMLIVGSHRSLSHSTGSPATCSPRIPAGGFHSEEEITRLPGAHRIDAEGLVPGPSAGVYAFYRSTIQRNLYRIPIP